MEPYRRLTEKVRGALWAHHRRLMPERQFHRILAYVYNNKYEFQIRFDKMQVVGRQWDGKVEVATTPAGHIKRVRVHPEFQDLPRYKQEQLVVAAFAEASAKGRKLMEEAELIVYKQFLRDLKPVVLGIRDNPEFFTVSEETLELPNGSIVAANVDPKKVYRTIPYEKAALPDQEQVQRQRAEAEFLESEDGRRWRLTLEGKNFLRYQLPSERVKGAPGPKRNYAMPNIISPYTAMDETPLRKRNWMAFLDNKHVAEALWTRTRRGDRIKKERELQRTGQAWHSSLNRQAEHNL